MARKVLFERHFSRLVGCSGLLCYGKKSTASTYDVVHAEVLRRGHVIAHVIARRTECDGFVIDFQEHEPRRTTLTDAEVDRLFDYDADDDDPRWEYA